MNDSDLQRLEHIRVYCEEIAETIVRFGPAYEAFARDKDFYRSVTMNIFQIGELVGGLSDAFKAATRKQILWGSIKGMRNFVAHDYARIDMQTVWDTAVNDVPVLLEFCIEILAQEENIQGVTP